MRDEDFEIFIENMGEATDKQAALPGSIERYRGVLPDYLLKVWEEEGWCGYRHGLFWTVNPADYEALAAKWLKGTPLETIDKYHVIGRTAFGDLYGWGERNDRRITIGCASNFIYAYNKVTRPNRDAEQSTGSFFSLMELEDCDLEADDESEDEETWLFERALKRYGALSRTEMYGFEPAPREGVSFSLKAIKRVNLFTHLDKLRDRTGVPGVPTAIANIGKYK